MTAQVLWVSTTSLSLPPTGPPLLPVRPSFLHTYNSLLGKRPCWHCEHALVHGEETMLDSYTPRIYHLHCYLGAEAGLPRPNVSRTLLLEQFKLKFPTASPTRLDRMCDFHRTLPVLLDYIDTPDMPMYHITSTPRCV